MKFTKMEGCGNDYIYVDITKHPLHDPEEFAIKFSDRHFGIGSDGLITIGLSDKADFFMHMYNNDGSQGSMCGNGIRCVAKFVCDNGLTDKDEFTIETLSGVKVIKVFRENGEVIAARVDMGEACTKAEKIPVTGMGDEVIEKNVHIAGRDWVMTCVSVGNPHAVIWDEDPDSLELEKIGPLFENNEMFPDRINTEFIHVIDKENIRMRVWERGSGETIACGTGATASAYACMITGKCGHAVNVHLKGGDLKIELDDKTGHLFMTGPAKVAFTGECDW